MKRLNILVEGTTEERFVNQIIYPHLINFNIITFVQKWFTNRSLGAKGGGRNYDLIQNHLTRWIKQEGNDLEVNFSVMVDLYSFPKGGDTIYDNEVSVTVGGIGKALKLEEKMKTRVSFHRFIPYVQLHEFEALILAKPQSLIEFYTDKQTEINQLVEEIQGLNPEDINETPEGAPSKRIIKYLDAYKKQKSTAGPFTANSIGLPTLRERCEHFNQWVNKLEQIASY
jgi:hypothetical protein